MHKLISFIVGTRVGQNSSDSGGVYLLCCGDRETEAHPLFTLIQLGKAAGLLAYFGDLT